ncbi:myo-inositol transporter [Purpureocillium lilacinum]|nr:myo-inositol transporter [Purpureocillium lilacinum]
MAAPSSDEASQTHADQKDMLDKVNTFNGSTNHLEDLNEGAYDDSIEDTAPSRAVWLITFTVAMGGFLFGYDTGYISAVLVTIGADLGHKLSSKEQELITSLTSGGALIGALIAGLPADKYGRKLGIYIGCALFLAGSIIQAAAFNVAQMAVGRFIVGLGVGSAAMIVPLYIGEIAPAKYRGRMIAFDNMSVTLGQLVSYGLGAAFTDVSHGWRYMVAVGGVPPIVLAALLPFCPESPRQLIAHGHMDEANRVIAKVYPYATDEQVKAKTNHILCTIRAENMARRVFGGNSNSSTAEWDLLRRFPGMADKWTVSQLGGFNTLMYYSGTLFALVGFDKPTLVSLVVGATNFVFTLFNMFIIDKVGRRRILNCTVIGMSLSMALTAVAFHFIPVSKDLVLEAKSVNWAGTLVLAMIIVYIGFYASGVATIGWVGTELLPTEVRALGTTMNTITCWGCNLIIASTFLSMMKGLTPTGAFGFYAGICFLGWVFLLCCYPEVKGLALEDVRQVFAGGFGVRKAAGMQKALKAARKQAIV